MRRPGTAWALLGLGACVLIAVTGPRLAGHGPTGWWFAPRIPGARAEFYVGLAALSLSWLALGPHVTRHGASVGQLRLIGAAWCAPLLAGPVLFSHDVYSYLAQGEILRLGQS